MNGLLVVGQFDALDLVQFLDAALHLLGLGGLIAESVDKRFEMIDPVLLIFVRRFQLRPPLGLLRDVVIVIPGVEKRALVPDFQNAIHGNVQKIAVVRDHHKGVGIIRQIIFQPVARFQVQMVGRLIEQQQVRLGQQKFRQAQAHLPAAGKLLRRAIQIVAAKTQSAEDLARLRLEGIAIVILKLGLNAVVAVHHLLVFVAASDRSPPSGASAFPSPFQFPAGVRKPRGIPPSPCAPKAPCHPAADIRSSSPWKRSRSLHRASRCPPAPSTASICPCHSRPPARRARHC